MIDWPVRTVWTEYVVLSAIVGVAIISILVYVSVVTRVAMRG